MTERLKGSKRLQVIQNWLNGKEDPNWEVFPTKNENKFIVKKRKEPLVKTKYDKSETDDEAEDENDKGNIRDTSDFIEPDEENPETQENNVPDTNPSPKKNKSTAKLIIKKPKPMPSPQQQLYPNMQTYDTVNIEILNQLKLLGEEIMNQRKKKETKKMMKNIARKELQKSYYRDETFREDSSDSDKGSTNEKINESTISSQPAPPIYRRRKLNLLDKSRK